MNNKNLGDLTPSQDQQIQPLEKQPAGDDPTAGFDLTREARQEALSTVKKVLDRAAQGGKTGRKQIDQTFRALYKYSKHTDDLLIAMVRDMYKIVRAIANVEFTVISLKANMEAQRLYMERNEILDQAEIDRILEKEVLHQYFPTGTTEQEETETE